jgi:hypothetical protein
LFIHIGTFDPDNETVKVERLMYRSIAMAAAMAAVLGATTAALAQSPYPPAYTGYPEYPAPATPYGDYNGAVYGAQMNSPSALDGLHTGGGASRAYSYGNARSQKTN